jgi:predicted dehydrogenase
LTNSKDRIKFGVIGCSKVAQRYFFPAVNSSEIASLEIIGSRSKEKAEAWAKQNNCKLSGNYDDVLNSNADAVYVSLPIGLHEEFVIKAAETGKHVLCEKSSTVSFESAKKMVESCKKNNVRLLEGFSFRFHPQHDLVLDYIRKERLGTIFNFYGIYGFPPPSNDDFRWKKELGGGVLNDVTCYPICASRIMFQSEPISVTSHLEYDRSRLVDMRNSIFMLYPENKTAFISSGFDNYYQSSYSVWGSKARITTKRSYAVPKNFTTSIYFHQDDEVKEIKISEADQFKIMLEKFCESILNCNSLCFNFEDDLLAQARVMEAVRLSHHEKRTVALNEII